MIRLARYLKPFLPQVLLAVVLLFIQAVSDLSLPEYLSKIVNVGIQQGGVENAVAKAVRRSEMKRLTIMMSPADSAEVLRQYTLIDNSSPGYATYVTEYPAVAREPVYVLNDIDQRKIDSLNPVMARAWVAVVGIERSMMPAQSGRMTPGGASPFVRLAQIPAAERMAMLDSMRGRFGAPAAGMVEQSAIRAVRSEYAALGVDTASLQTAAIMRIGLVMLLISLLAGICTVAVGYVSGRVAAGLARDLRRFVFTKVESFSNTEFDRFSTSSLITRSTNDITQIQTTIGILIRIACYAPIMGAGGVIMAIRTSPSMSWIIAVGVIVLVGVIVTIFAITLPKFAIIQKLLDRLNLVTGENLSGVMVVRAFNAQAFEERRFDKANQDLTDTNLYVNRVMAFMMPVMMLVMNGVSVVILWVGAHRVAESAMQVGDMIAFIQYALLIVFAFIFLSFMFVILPRASVSAGRIADVLETPLSIQDPADPKGFSEPFNATIEFRDVSFRYPGAEEDALHSLSFTARPGETTAFIGSTGSGKSTLVNLIPRFYDVSGGAILVDGRDIRQVSQHDLRDRIGYVPQQANLFSGTIESNLRYADAGAPEERLKMATDTAQATGFIATMPKELASEISQGGTNVSGGQRQRLSIARALVKRPPIYIFDDSFSALDFKTDAALRHALKETTGSSTVLIVAQRIATIKTAEQIIVLDDGKIVGKGSHSELMKSCETYREIALSQLTAGELE